ncbi:MULTISPECIES: TrbI/VirB10 family protein [Psychrilyobacter]|uniref:Conjugal transfer protein TrbI n=1 Tax=Psychrilyobacter piezotolerans TaxID=2293438 RepID=A0ABX9KIW6_9FUSO|nr:MULTISPECIES: TrbI/VirB10 family protein [Psychrilyobacter]MCS5420277.1 TrbI/VirB10 family protein [Psychrilyobacter sp. S5]NDI77302.1 TrbI/VirB10 family protein [Psychrilyobacter piezotolerans]RDE63356.1 hypothetical protein DV867_05650 [Psychrilyobacter sp. S5]REI41898.1 hypothetical protein DYH56_05650 [Psychrilyobacter piezotolerans]
MEKVEIKGVHISKKMVVLTALGVILVFILLLVLKPSKKEVVKVVETQVIEKIEEDIGLPGDYVEQKEWENQGKEIESYEKPPEDGYQNNYEQEVPSYYADQEEQKRLAAIELAKASKIGFMNSGSDYSKKNIKEKKEMDAVNETSLGFYNTNYLKAREELPLKDLEVKQGTIIPSVTISKINSDLPGDVVAQVSENVYDSKTGNYLLIPKGSKLYGSYLSDINFGQERIGVNWDRIIFPNQKSINLIGMAGITSSGEKGLKDKVNNHYGKLLQGIVFSSVLATTTSIVTDDNGSDDDDRSYLSIAGETASLETIKVGNKIVERSLSVDPTIEIRNGMKFNILVNKDIILSEYEL